MLTRNAFSKLTMGRVFMQPTQYFATSFAPRNNTTATKPGVDLFLGNLGSDVTAVKLKASLVAKYDGEFNGPRIVFNRETKQSLGYGYVTCPNEEEADKMVAALQGIKVADVELKVNLAQEKRILRAAYFGNLSMDVTEEDISELVEEKYGKDNIVKVRIPREGDERSKGFGHVEFTTNALREQAISDLNGVSLKGRPMKVDKAVLKSRLPVICINNISYDVTKHHLEEMFDDLVGHENYADVKLHHDKITGYPRGFAHVTFISKRVADKALDELRGIEMMGRPLRAQLVDSNNKKKNNDN